MALITAPGDTLADALTDLTKIGSARLRAEPLGVGVLVVRRRDGSVVAAFVDEEVPHRVIRDEPLLRYAS